MTRTNRIALTALVFCTAAQVVSAQSAGLVAGGNTIAGPGATKLAAQAQQDVYTDASGNSDACVTLVNTGKGAIRVALTGEGSSNIDVAAGATAAV
ncbi:hypothetical protein K2X89_13085, partial [Myxococcota bacterium]|nr:hypothetical protein [Myxococcota bacterium]